MRIDDVKESVVSRVLATLPETFRTKQLSQHPDMLAAHGLWSGGNDISYNPTVGKYLSTYGSKHGVQQIGPPNAKGALWQRPTRTKPKPMPKEQEILVSPERPSSTVTVSPSVAPGESGLTRLISGIRAALTSVQAPVAPAPSPPVQDTLAGDIGPQCAGDSAFMARMRFHQSWYRAYVLHLACGTGPTRSATAQYGNMLRSEDGESGRNSLTPEINEVARERLAEGQGLIDEYRLLHNMLSSQPMCFNLFGPLVADLRLATRLWAQLFPQEVQGVTRVQLEYAPQPAREYLGDRTAFDVLIEYTQPSGRRGFFGVETKLGESLIGKQYDSPAYRRWMDGDNTPWLPEASRDVASPRFNQLWRDHLLSEAMLRRPGSAYTAGAFVLIHHPGDQDCARIVDGYKRLLRPGRERFIDLPLDAVVSAWVDVLEGSPSEQWIADFSHRYLQLEDSQADWEAR